MKRFFRRFGVGLLASLVTMPLFAIQPATTGNMAQATDAKPIVDADGTYHLGNGVTAPKLVSTVDAEFSDAALRKKIGANVVVGLNVGVDGLPKDVHVTRSAAENFTKPKDRRAAATLDEKALEAVRQYRFEPGTYQGKAVPVAITVEVNFHTYPDK